MLLSEFRSYLIDSGVSNITAKNYVSDVNKFFKWFENNFTRPFAATDLTPDLVALFIKTRGGLITVSDGYNGLSEQSIQESVKSDRSLERYNSTLRRFAKYLTSTGQIDENPFEKIQEQISSAKSHNDDPWNIKDFKNFLYINGATPVTSKNYIVDIKSFTTWLTMSQGIDLAEASFSKINSEVINEYKHRLSSILNLSPKSVNRKLSAIRKYLSFLESNNLLQDSAEFENIDIEKETEKNLNLEDFKTDTTELDDKSESPIAPVRLFTKLASPYLLVEDLLAAKLASRVNEKKLFKKAYPTAAPQKKTFVPNVTSSFYAPPTNLADQSLGKKILYHARYTRPNWYKAYHNIAITHYVHLGILLLYVSVVGMLIYNSTFKPEPQYIAQAQSIASGKTFSFSGILADANDTPITSATDVRFQIYDDRIASGSSLLWQEVNNIKPSQNGSFTQVLGERTQIPQEVFANHSRLFIGLSIENGPELSPRQEIAQVNFASNSRMVAGMQAITDTDKTSNVILALDSSGNLTIGGNANPVFQATGGQFKISGLGMILATNEGSNSDIVVSPDGLGRLDIQKPIVNSTDFGGLSPGAVEIDDKVLIQATESAVAAFVINNNGSGDILSASSSGTTRFTIANNGDLSIQPGATIDTLSFGQLKIGSNNASNISIGRFGQTITLPGFTKSGGILFTNGLGELSQVSTSSDGKCLISQGFAGPSWEDCRDPNFHYNQGALVFNNLNSDFLIGGESTSSAKFAFYNVGNGIPTATIKGNLNVLPTGDSSGKVGIGTTDPQALLHIKSSQDTNVLRLEDQDGICDHNPEAASEIVSCSSDERLKTDISDGRNGLIDLLKFKIHEYTIKASGQKATGVIAQEVQETNPELVHTNSEGILMVEQPSVWKIVLAIQELYKKVGNATVDFFNLTTNSLAVATDSITIAGRNINDYIIYVTQAAIENGEINLISPVASINQVNTSIISPLAGDTVEVKGKVVIVKDTVATSSPLLEVQGSASIAGTLASESVETNNLQTQDATISGTLYANNIQANSIEGLDSKIASIAGQTLANNPQASISADQIAGIVASELANMQASLPTLSHQLLDVSNLSADFATFRNGFVALGPATFGQASFLDGISIGTSFILGPSSLDTLGQDLEIQPLRQGAISFMGGSIKIDTQGDLKVNGNANFAGNVQVAGKLSANVISPLAKKNLIIEGQDATATGSPTNQNLVDVRGSIAASGSATFNKLNLSLVEPAYAISDTEVVATGSAGTAAIRRYRTELTIDNPNVTAKSLIYITPVGTTNNQTIYLLRQLPNKSFTVGIGTPVGFDVKFNWIIVN